MGCFGGDGVGGGCGSEVICDCCWCEEKSSCSACASTLAARWGCSLVPDPEAEPEAGGWLAASVIALDEVSRSRGWKFLGVIVMSEAVGLPFMAEAEAVGRAGTLSLLSLLSLLLLEVLLSLCFLL